MPLIPIKINPGVDVEATPLLNEAGWSSSNLIRFFNGKIQKLGGWTRIISQALTGICRGMLAWADLTGATYVALGTNQRVQVIYDALLYDITPIRKTSNLTTPIVTNYSTASLSNLFKITDNNHGAVVGDTIYFPQYVYANNNNTGNTQQLNGYYQVLAVIDANTYAIGSFTSADTNTTGVTALFTTTFGQNSVEVTLGAHGFGMGNVFTVYTSTTVGGLTLYGPYIVQSVIDNSHFTINSVGSATSNASASENGGLVQIQYLISSGNASAVTAVGGYGEGGYGEGGYGEGQNAITGAVNALRQWTMLAFGQDWVGCPTNGSIYLWNPSAGEINNPATLISVNAPAVNTGIFLAMPQQQIIAFGCTNPSTGNQDPMLIRWCDVGDYTDWTATTSNQAGSFRLPRGSKIVGGVQGPQFGLVWTDIGIWLMQYIGYPLVYGFNEIASGCGLISLRAMGILNGQIFWMSQNGFFLFNGSSVVPIPCTVWDIVFRNLNTYQQDKITCAANSYFNEIAWHFPSASGNGENDTYVKYNMVDNVWDYGPMTRTAWFNQSVFGPPMGTDANGLVQQHEISADADGVAMMPFATTGWFKISNGTQIIFVERMISDFIMSGGNTMTLTISVADYPNDTPETVTFNWTQATEYNIIRLRGRFVKMTIGSSDLGSFWRMGEPLYMGTAAGRR